MTSETNLSNLPSSPGERTEFLAYLRKVACELRSAQAGLSLLAKICTGLSEQERGILNDNATNIASISADLLAKGSSGQGAPSKGPSYTLASIVASEILNKKRSQYDQVNFKWRELGIGDGSFIFIKIEPKDFDLFTSSIIDRSVKASDNKGEINVSVGSDSDHVWFVVTDYGKKIPSKEVSDINSAFTEEVYFRTQEILQNNGKVYIDSCDERTCVTLTFPRVDCPDWMAKRIIVHDGDTIVVLTDDQSIYDEWYLCFKTENVALVQKKSNEDAINFINEFTPKSRLFFLADFDLLNKESKGLQTLWQTLMQEQSIFMTSSYSDQGILDFAHKVGVQILPKQLVAKTPYTVVETEREIIIPAQEGIVVIDDDKPFADTLATYIKNKNLVVKAYYNPYDFLKDLSHYAKNVKIIIDNSLGANLTGLEIAKQLHASDYNNIYLITGKVFALGEVPDYITLIPKGDMDALNKAIQLVV